jgi:gentisate 1,2-dioxygenase
VLPPGTGIGVNCRDTEGVSVDGLLSTVNREAEVGRGDFYRRIGQQNLGPLWRVLGALVTDTPNSPCVPAHWSYRKVRPYLMEACEIISTEESERRVLVLENPGMPGQSRITRNLFAGLQTILPGEIAPAHRHVASALRFIVEGKNAYTAVGGERTMMLPGDFVITPSWAWHDHGNIGDGPMVWLDGLDMHIVNMCDASFRDGYPGKVHPETRPQGSSDAEVGANLVPVDFKHKSQTTPIFNYPYAATRAALDGLRRLRDPDACHGYKMRYINPLTGGTAIPTMTCAMQLLPRGFTTLDYRCTAGTAYCVVEGRGTANIGDQVFSFEPHDLMVAPSWNACRLHADEDAVIFSFSDQVVQEKLDFFREQRGGG